MRAAYRGKILTPGAEGLRFWGDGLLVVSERGTIERVGPYEASADVSAVDVRPGVIVPGFVDAHVHFPQTRIVGSATGPLLEWLERSVFPEESRFGAEAYARVVAAEFVGAMIAAGTTTAMIFSSSHLGATHLLFDELSRRGMRAIAGLTLMDRACPEALAVPADRALHACEELIARWHGHDSGRLSFAVTPRFAISCSRPLLEGAGRLAADRGVWVQTHVSENPFEERATLEVHPYAADYLQVYEAANLVGPRTILAHAIHLSAPAWDRLAKAGARVAHCPDSNFFLGSGRMKLTEATRRRIPVALGSDVAGGRSFSIRRAMASAYDTALCTGSAAGPAELFELATRGGAAALGLDDVTGSLEAGKDADFVVVDLPEYAETEAQVLGHVVFATDVTRVRGAFVRGRALL